MKEKFSELFIRIFREKTDNTLFQLIRYTFVGGFAFIVDFGTLFLLTEYLYLHYLVSAAIAFILGLVTNYFLSIGWVFTRHTVSDKRIEFIVFALIGLVGLGLNELFLWLFTDLAGMYYLISKILTAVLVYLWNFFVRKLILFNK
ncbi:MAG TPA: GtrA family protein [Bacteroidales bacterium]|nr:GtrA family protein [Bacteroidales bacterium]